MARARKYYEDYRVQLRAKLLRARTREEKVRMRGPALQEWNSVLSGPQC